MTSQTNDLEEQVIRVIKKVCFSPDEVIQSGHLTNDLGLTSIGLIELLVELELAFNINLDESIFDNQEVNYVSDIVSIVRDQLEKPAK